MTGTGGKNLFVLVGKESTYGTEAGTIEKSIGIVNNVSPNDTNNINRVGDIGDREAVDLIVGNFDTSIAIDGTLNSGAPLELFFGQSTDVETTGDFKHTFVERGVLDIKKFDIPSFSLSENYNTATDKQITHLGCKYNTLDIDIELGGVLEYSSEILGSDIKVDGSIGTQVSNATQKFGSYSITLMTGTEGAEAELGLTRSVSVSLNNNIDATELRTMGSRLAQGLIEKNLDVSFSFTKTFGANTTEYERFLGGTTALNGTPTKTSVIFKASNGITLGSGLVEFYIKVSGGVYESTDRTTSDEGVTEETYEYTGGNIEEVYFIDSVGSYF